MAHWDWVKNIVIKQEFLEQILCTFYFLTRVMFHMRKHESNICITNICNNGQLQLALKHWLNKTPWVLGEIPKREEMKESYPMNTLSQLSLKTVVHPWTFNYVSCYFPLLMLNKFALAFFKCNWEFRLTWVFISIYKELYLHLSFLCIMF